MRFPILIVALTVSASPVIAQSTVSSTPGGAAKGQMLSSADRSRLGSVLRVNGDGSVAIIFDSRLLTIPASTLKSTGGKLTTSLSKREIASLR